MQGASAQQLQKLVGAHRAGVWSLAWLPNGSYFVSGAFGIFPLTPLPCSLEIICVVSSWLEEGKRCLPAGRRGRRGARAK